MSDGPTHLAYSETIHETLGIRAIDIAAERVVLEMDVEARVHQPMGLLHGGATAVLAESAASIGAYMSCDPDRQYAVGIDLNISHLRAVSSGTVRATATPIRKGRTIHVWGIDVVDQDGAPVAASRCTLAIRSIDTSSESQEGQT